MGVGEMVVCMPHMPRRPRPLRALQLAFVACSHYSDTYICIETV